MVRLGISGNEITAGLGSILALNFGKINFDYSFGYPYQVEDTSGSHKISVTLKF
jgi:hypothetical protein